MKKRIRWTAPAMALAALALLASCGKQSFQKAGYSASAVAGQYVYIKPKLDLVIFQDNSDSLANLMAQMKPQFYKFLSSLDTNWEYRVVVMPLLYQQPVSQKYVLATDCTGLQRCLSPSQVNQFNSLVDDSGWINSHYSAGGNVDYGFAYMNYNINSLRTSGIFRNDSLKAFVVISNNDDQTNVVYRTDAGGAQVGIDYNNATTIASFNAYSNYFTGLKQASPSGISLSKLYSVVVPYNPNGNCGGGRVWVGKRYMDMATVIGGGSYDICSGGLINVLGNISANLQVVVQTVVFNYVVLPDEPDPSSIKLLKNGATVPNSSVNGWTYAGYLPNQPTSYSPSLGNYKSGYMIRLNGTAEFKGSDAISIDYKKK